MALLWKEYKKIIYANSGEGFFWLIYPSGHKGQAQGDSEEDLKLAIDGIKLP